MSEQKTGSMVSEWMTIEEAAQYLRLSPKTLYNWRCQGKAIGVRVAGRGKLLFRREELDRLIVGKVRAG